MINEMRKLHLELRAQRGQKQSPAFVQFSNDLQPGNDYYLELLGEGLLDVTKFEKDPASVLSIGNSRAGIQVQTDRFKSLYEKLSTTEDQTRARQLLAERLGVVASMLAEPAVKSLQHDEKLKCEKRKLALEHLLEVFAENKTPESDY